MRGKGSSRELPASPSSHTQTSLLTLNLGQVGMGTLCELAASYPDHNTIQWCFDLVVTTLFLEFNKLPLGWEDWLLNGRRKHTLLRDVNIQKATKERTQTSTTDSL